MVSKKIFSLIMLPTIGALQGRADTQTRNDISVSLDDFVPYAHKFVVKDITSERFVKEAAVYPLKLTVVNRADYPVVVSIASIGGLQFVPGDKVANQFVSPLGASLAVTGGVSGLLWGVGSGFQKQWRPLFRGLAVLSFGTCATGVYLYIKGKKELAEEFKKCSIGEPYTIQPGERYEGFMFLTKEAYNNQLCNITLAQAGNEENVTAFAFHL